MNFQIRLRNEKRLVERSGVWTASNVHTAVSRALTGYPTDHKSGDVAHTGIYWTKLSIGQEITIEVKRL